MNYNDDELEKALFSLPLEAPPPDLRASILAATVHKAPPLFKPWEIGAIVAVIGALACLVWSFATGGMPNTAALVSANLGAVTRWLTDITTLSWIAAGGATAIWLSLWVNQTPPLRERSHHR